MRPSSRRPECKEHIAYPAPYTYMQQWADLDLAAEWKRVEAPVLIVQGESDFVATVADAPLLRDEKTAAGEFDPRVLETLQGWLTQQAAG